jgi:Na+/melibiose symporter-like transporter
MTSGSTEDTALPDPTADQPLDRPGWRVPWRLLRRRRDLRLLLGAGLVSMTGDWLLGIGLTYSVYALTGSTLASAVTLLASFVPATLAGLVAGVFVDRWDRKRTMITANLLLAVGLVPLVLVRDADQIWLVYVVLVWEALVEVFFAPAEQAMLPRVVDEQQTGELVTANALNSQNQNLSRLVGSGLGGVAAAVGGIPAVAVLDAVTFVVATLLLLRIRTSGRVAARPVRDEGAEELVAGRFAELRTEWVEGLRVSWHTPVIRVLLAFSLVTAVGEGIMGTLFAPFVRAVLHGGPQALGVITGAQAIGGVVGGLVVASVGSRWRPTRMLGLGSVVFGLVDLAIFLYPLLLVQAWPAAVGMVVVGLPGAIVTAGMMTLFQTHSTDAQRGRVFSLVLLVRSVATVVGTTAAGFLGDSVGIVPVLAFQGVGYVVGGLLVALTIPREEVSGPPTLAT